MRAKSHIISLLLLLVSFGSVSAQNHYEANIAIGAKAGYTLSKLNFNPSVPQGLQGGLLIGGTFRYVEEKNFGLIAELNVEQRGWKEQFEGQDFQYSRKLTYLQIPILTHIYFSSNKFKGFFNAGPEIGYMIASGTSANFDILNPFPISLSQIATTTSSHYLSKTNSITAFLPERALSGSPTTTTLSIWKEECTTDSTMCFPLRKPTRFPDQIRSQL